MPVEIKHDVLIRRDRQSIARHIDRLVRDHGDRGLGTSGDRGDGVGQGSVQRFFDLSDRYHYRVG